MKAGDLRHRITIQVSQRSANAIGEWVDTWATWQTVWAAVEPLAGNKYFQAKQANSQVSGVVRIRHLDGLLPTMRISYAGRILLIDSISRPRENRQEIIIYYKEALD